ncbi:RnfH family protein [Methylococcus sp. EFPC2]|uniref:RnfH family protein n=1 Tax=Methylococcus sp. EFPC2 TaxID=2812648 RepID=UPI001967B525|nr:RnfH family protein [Methylococcus sp. EFPC2]QSA98981.1 RnfH family protein [Methylococcus sp. EFPC2]
MKIEVAYAKPGEQVLLALDVLEGSTAEQAIRQSGILERFPEIDLEQAKIGIYSKPCKLDQPVKSGDRLEIYRPLIADPKEARRNRAAKKGEAG